MIKRFLQYIRESSDDNDKHVAVLYGRMNPPTSGHEANINGLKAHAKKVGADHLVIASHSHDSKKNPLSPQQKEKHLKRAFPNTNITMSSKERPSIYQHVEHLHDQGYRHLTLAGGEDRAGELEKIKKYHGPGTEKPFKSINVVNTGARSKGVSGTDMGNHVHNNDFHSFKKNLPSALKKNEGHAKDLFHDVKGNLKK